MIYYFEKIDITEELVRLETHLNYFLKTIETETAQGKKLGFISQEIGREINTIGSKANDAEIQKHVIRMKDELEKIIASLGASSPADMGKVMGPATKQLAGKADGKAISETVKQLLAQG